MRRLKFALLALGSILVAVPSASSVDSLPCIRRDLQLLARATSNDERSTTVQALLAARGLPFEVQPFANPYPGAIREFGGNIIVDLGDGPRDIVVGAHFDAAATSDAITQGAIDNGAGVVALQRLAQTLSERQLRHRVRVVLFDMEELGLVGSRHYAETAEPGRTAAMVNVDVVGMGETMILGRSAAEGNEVTFAAAAIACARVAVGCLRFPRFPPSDDLSFQAIGVPNISVSALPRVQADQLWMRLNGGFATGQAPGPQPRVFSLIHTLGDVVEEVDPRSVTLVHRFLLALVLELDASLP